MEEYQLRNQQQILLNWHPKVNFATEQEIRDALLKRYYFEEICYHSTWAMTQALQNHSDLIADKYNKLYKTTLLEYDVLGDVDIKETMDEGTSSTGSANSTVNTKDNEFPMGQDINTERPVGSSKNDSSSFSNTKRNREYTLRRSGSNGMRTKQELIEQERKIILSIIPQFIEEFTNLFLIRI